MASDIPGRPGWSNTGGRWNVFGFGGLTPQQLYARGASIIGEQMMRGPISTVGGGYATVPRSVGMQTGILGAFLWAAPRMATYSEELNRRADAYGAAVGAVPTRQIVYAPPTMPSGLTRRAADQWRAQHGFQLPIALDVPAVGINNPVLAGSREDPRGPRRPVWR